MNYKQHSQTLTIKFDQEKIKKRNEEILDVLLSANKCWLNLQTGEMYDVLTGKLIEDE